MINLIPNEEKKIIIKDFYYRLVIVILLVLAFVILIASISLLPSYFISSVKKNISTEKLNTEEININNEKIFSTISDIDKKLSLLEKTEQEKFLVSERVINEILSKKISGIKITQIYFEDNEIDGRKISIRGTAPSRERLSLFSTTLENNSLFKEVDLPISNFVKGYNIQFYLTLIPS